MIILIELLPIELFLDLLLLIELFLDVLLHIAAFLDVLLLIELLQLLLQFFHLKDNAQVGEAFDICEWTIAATGEKCKV